MAYDHNTLFFEKETVTATKTSDVIDFHGPDLDQINYRIVIQGTVSGTSPKVIPTLESSDDNSIFTAEKEFPAITQAGEYNNRFRSRHRYRRLKLTVSGTSASFADLTAGMDSGSRYTEE